MKLNSTLFALLFLIFISCGKESKSLAPDGPKTETPEPQKDDQDEKKYGKSVLLGSQNYTIKAFKKIKYNENIDYMEVTVDAPSAGDQPALKLFAHVLRLDRKALAKDYSIEALQGGQYLADRASPNTIMKNQTNTKRRVLAIVNGDFFDMAVGGTMLGAMINNGRVIKTANNGWKLTYGLTKTNEFFVDELNYPITVGADNVIINEINGSRAVNTLILYTTAKGEKSGANAYGSEILLKPLLGDWETLPSYENVVCEVVSNPTSADGGLTIPKGHIVLSGHGTGRQLIDRNKIGDKLTVKVGKPKGKSGIIYDVKEAVGAAYLILAKGDVKTINSSSGNPGGKEPRTAIGHSDDYFYMVAIEGRSAKSDGLTVTHLAHLLKHFDVKEAVNLDGGGSTMLAVGTDIYGQPAGTTWFRPVPNAFSIVRYN